MLLVYVWLVRTSAEDQRSNDVVQCYRMEREAWMVRREEYVED